MKNENSKDRLSYSSTTHIHGNVLAWNKPASKPEKSKVATENIQHWEDDGGPVSEAKLLLPPVAGTNTPRLSEEDSDRS